MENLLTREQAASMLGLAPATLAAMAVDGDGPPMIRVSPRCIRYSPEDLRAWAAARKVSSTSEPTGANKCTQ